MESDIDVPVKATRVSFDVVDTLRELDGARVTEVADHLDLPRSTGHNHMRTLEELELVVNEDGTSRPGRGSWSSAATPASE